MVSSEYPEYGATDAIGYPLVAVEFRESMGGSPGVILQDNAGTPVAGTDSYSEGTFCYWPGICYDRYFLFFYPSGPLAPGTQYTLTLTALDISYAFTTRLDLGTDTWQQISTTNDPSERSGHTAVWTGTEMIVWGGI